MVQSKVFRVIQHDIAHQILTVGIGDIGPTITIEFTLTDVVGDIEFIVTVPVRIRTEGRECQTVDNGPSTLTMNIDRGVLIGIIDFK